MLKDLSSRKDSNTKNKGRGGHRARLLIFARINPPRLIIAYISESLFAGYDDQEEKVVLPVNV